MAQYTVPAAEFRRVILAVSVSAAKDDSRPVLAGIYFRKTGSDRFDIAAADGFRLSVAAVHTETADSSSPAVVLHAKPLAMYARTIKPSSKGMVTFGPAGDRDDAPQWQFSCTDHPDGVLIDMIPGTFPDYRQIVPRATATNATFDRAQLLAALDPIKPVDRKRSTSPAIARFWLRADDGDSAITGSGMATDGYTAWIDTNVSGPDLHIAFNSAYLRDMVKTASGPIVGGFNGYGQAARFDAGDVTTVIMPMVIGSDGTIATGHEPPRYRDGTDAPATDAADSAPEPAPAVEPPAESESVRPDEAYDRNILAAQARVAVKRAVRRAATAAPDPEPSVTRPCPQCGTPAEPDDRFCGQCGTRLDAPAADPVIPETTSDDATVGNWPGYVPIEKKYSGKNPARIYNAMPWASDVRGFHDWLRAGRCVRKGQRGIMIYVPIKRDAVSTHWQDEGADLGEKTAGVRRAYVFDISQTDVLAAKDDAITPADTAPTPRPVAVAATPANVTPFPHRAAVVAAPVALRAADI